MTTQEIKNIFTKTSDEVKKHAEEFLNLSYNQINWRPADSQWSIGECFEHLIRTNMKYIPAYKKYQLPDKANEHTFFRHSLIGKLIMKTVMPSYKRKFKTPDSFNPVGSDIKENVVLDFLSQNNELTNLD